MAVIPGESYLTASLEISVFTGTSFRDTVLETTWRGEYSPLSSMINRDGICGKKKEIADEFGARRGGGVIRGRICS
jgi:hypothetical protein